MNYPTRVKYKDEYYPINTSYKVGLKCMRLNDDSTITDTERALGILTLLFGGDVARMTLTDVEASKFFVEKTVTYLQCGVEAEVQSKRVHDMDLNEDFKYIATSLETQYRINIREEDLHFWRFVDLIEGLNGTLIDRIREIRNIDLNDYKNDIKTKNQIIELKNHYSLDKTKIDKTVTLKELYEQIERG